MSKALLREAGQPADRLQRADAVGQDARGDDDQEHAGVGEELGEVDAHGAEVHAVGDGHRDEHADDEAEQRPRGLGLGVPDHEQRGLDALAADGEEGERRARQGRRSPVRAPCRRAARRRWSRRPSSSRAPWSSRSRRRPATRRRRWPRRPGRRWCSRRTGSPGRRATVITIAAPTPSHTHLSASRRFDLTRNATRMVTTMAASRPSRRPISPLPNSCEVTLGPAARTRHRNVPDGRHPSLLPCRVPSFGYPRLGMADLSSGTEGTVQLRDSSRRCGGVTPGAWDDGGNSSGSRSPVSPVRWLRAVAVIGATALLMASSCSWQTGHPDPRGRAAAAGDRGAQDRHARQGQARRSAARLGGRTCARPRHPVDGARGLRVRGAGRRGGEPEVSPGVDHAGGHRDGGEPSRHLPRRDDRAER